jgi:hypothetical protein
MPRILRALGDEFQSRFNRKKTAPVNQYEGFTERGEVVLRDLRGTRRAELPDINVKADAPDSNPLVIYRPSGAKTVDASIQTALIASRTRPQVPSRRTTVQGGGRC